MLPAGVSIVQVSAYYRRFAYLNTSTGDPTRQPSQEAGSGEGRSVIILIPNKQEKL